MAYLPKSIRNLITTFERLPGIGPKSAVRLVFYLLNTPHNFVKEFADSLLDLKKEVKICRECYSVSENEICGICADKGRDKNLICVVERAIDVMALENVGGYKGVYFVLGGVINPLDHVGPDDLKIDELIEKVEDKIQMTNGQIEVILATNPTMEGEATALYIKKRIESKFQIPNSKFQIKMTRIGSGLPMGADLEFADQATLSRALEGRIRL